MKFQFQFYLLQKFLFHRQTFFHCFNDQYLSQLDFRPLRAVYLFFVIWFNLTTEKTSAERERDESMTFSEGYISVDTKWKITSLVSVNSP